MPQSGGPQGDHEPESNIRSCQEETMSIQHWRGALCALACTLALSPVALAADVVKVGLVGNASDAPVYIAQARGYFRDAGIEIQTSTFDSAAKQIAPLATGDLDVGGGATSAGLFNAATRKIDLRIVADRSRMAPGYSFMTLMIRKDLIDSGRFKSYADLKGLKIALAAPAIAPSTMLNAAAEKGGLTFDDIEKVYIGYPLQVSAFHSKVVDGSMMIEPFATAIVKANEGVRFSTTEDFLPSAQIALVYYGEKFASGKTDIGKRFMKAYVRACRDYNDAVVNGKFGEDANAQEIVRIVSKGINMSEADVREAYVQALDPDARPNLEAVARDLAFFRKTGSVTGDVKLNQIVDLSFVEAAVKELGPYKPKGK
jgi:NitT/TauT family transport system substrate-binding protein